MNNDTQTENPYAEYERMMVVQNQKRKRKFRLIAGVIITLFVFGFIVFIFLIGRLMKNTSAYETAEAYISNSAEVQNASGGIKDFGMFPAGSVSTSNDYGEASFTIDVNGKKHDLDVYVLLEKAPDGEWQVLEMEIVE